VVWGTLNYPPTHLRIPASGDLGGRGTGWKREDGAQREFVSRLGAPSHPVRKVLPGTDAGAREVETCKPVLVSDLHAMALVGKRCAWCRDHGTAPDPTASRDPRADAIERGRLRPVCAITDSVGLKGGPGAWCQGKREPTGERRKAGRATLRDLSPAAPRSSSSFQGALSLAGSTTGEVRTGRSQGERCRTSVIRK